MADNAIGGVLPVGAGANGSTQATSAAFGLGFEDLLRIVLTQLTYQDPLKPMENFEFISQLAQFTQIQQTETMSERMLGLLQAASTNQATSLLGRTVDVSAGQATFSGSVTGVSFTTDGAQAIVRTSDGRTVSNIPLSSIIRVAVED